MVEIRILLPSMKIERAKRARETAEGLGGGGGGGAGGKKAPIPVFSL